MITLNRLHPARVQLIKGYHSISQKKEEKTMARFECKATVTLGINKVIEADTKEDAREEIDQIFTETAYADMDFIGVDYSISDELPNPFEPISYNSGGGIWICEMNLGDGTYAVIDSESIICNMECLSIYNEAEEPFMPEDMFFSENLENLDSLHKALYMHMKEALTKEMESFGYSL